MDNVNKRSYCCQPLFEARQAARLGAHFTRSMRRLEFSLRQCQRCRFRPSCAQIEALSRQIEAAVIEINQRFSGMPN